MNLDQLIISYFLCGAIYTLALFLVGYEEIKSIRNRHSLNVFMVGAALAFMAMSTVWLFHAVESCKRSLLRK